MNIIHRSPFNTDFGSDLNTLFQRLSESKDQSNVATSEWSPHVDIKEDAKQFTITADVPGVAPQDIDITMENGVLTLKGQREAQQSEEAKDGSYSRIERHSGSFYRRFSLPDTANSEDVHAKTKHGVLTICIPKQAQKVARKISISTEDA